MKQLRTKLTDSTLHFAHLYSAQSKFLLYAKQIYTIHNSPHNEQNSPSNCKKIWEERDHFAQCPCNAQSQWIVEKSDIFANMMQIRLYFQSDEDTGPTLCQKVVPKYQAHCVNRRGRQASHRFCLGEQIEHRFATPAMVFFTLWWPRQAGGVDYIAIWVWYKLCTSSVFHRSLPFGV